METKTKQDWLSDEEEGSLSIDAYQDEHNVYIVAPIAGVKSSDIDISITEEVVTIKGIRTPDDISPDKYMAQECYWGSFSRSYVLPIPVNTNSCKATLKDGLLKIQISKDDRIKTKVIKIDQN